MLDTLTKQQKKWIIVSLAGLLVLTAGWYLVTAMTAQNTLELSGLAQAKEVKNGSRFGGRVNKVLVKEGSKVNAGDTLVLFDDTELRAKIAEARAALSQAEAQQKLMAKGANLADIRQAKAQVDQAQENVRMLTKGARQEELSQAEAKVAATKKAYEASQTQLKNAEKMLTEGIISQNRYDEMNAALESTRSRYQTASSGLKVLKSGSPEQIKIARSQLSATRAQYHRLTKGAEPEELEIAMANVEKAKSVLDGLEGQLNEVEIKSPISGHVSVVSVTEGELVQPGQPVVSIIDYDNLWADVYLPETQMDFVKIGKPVTVKASVLKKTLFDGRVAMINPKSEFMPNSVGAVGSEEATFRIKVEIESTDRKNNTQLYPGMQVSVVFTK